MKHRITSAYHPQSNGLDERTNQTLKKYDGQTWEMPLYKNACVQLLVYINHHRTHLVFFVLTCIIYYRCITKVTGGHHADWDEIIDPILFSIRTSVQESTKYTPFFLMHGREARYPFEMEKASGVYDPIELGEVQRAIDRLHAVREIFSDVSKNIDTSQRFFFSIPATQGTWSKHTYQGRRCCYASQLDQTYKEGPQTRGHMDGPYKVLDISKYGCCHLQCIATGKDLKTKVKINQLKVYQEP